MHRSGTSALTGALAAGGFELGEDLFGPGIDNVKGHFESIHVLNINEEALATRGLIWWSPVEFAFEPTKSEIEAACHVIRTLASRPWAMKDPRLCRLWPLWDLAASRSGVDVRIMMPIRHPLQVAKSMNRRDGFDLQHGLLLWVRHHIDALFKTQDRSIYFVDYESFLTEPVGVVAAVMAELNLGLSASRRQAVQDFVDPELSHHRRAVAAPSDVFEARCYSTFDYLRSAAHGEMPSDEARKAFLEAWSTPAARADLLEYTCKVTHGIVTEQAVVAEAEGAIRDWYIWSKRVKRRIGELENLVRVQGGHR